ncbi:hypothetical protein [Kordiimonas gwangyangensis]|uniref:hypothetical protein n=1 Tax=Kordiimonas gwangyangensis TaxID=288022 RepID=UPI00037DF75A|nr:hypothetical protein [Kordiimonas gwangyangensis]
MTKWPDADPADVKSVEAVIAAFDDTLSFNPGAFLYNDERLRSLFVPTASILCPAPWNIQLSPLEWGGFFAQAAKDLGFTETGFAEKNHIRKLTTIGHVSSVYTFYTLHSPPASEAVGQGINMWHIVNLSGRHAIASLIWEDESETAVTPPELMA